MIFDPFERMVAFRYLRARRAGGVRLGHRDLLAARHRARGRDADHRDVGDERVPRRAGRPHSRAQRPSRRLWRGRAADRFRGRRRARAAGPGRGQRDAADRGAGHGDRRCRRLRRAGARHPPRGHPRAQADRRPYRRRLARRVRRRRDRGRRTPGAAARGRGRRPDHADLAGRHRHRLRHGAAAQDLSRSRRCSMSASTNTTTASSMCRCDSAQIFFRMPEAVSDLEVFVENPDRVQSASAAQIAAALGGRVRIVDWQQANSTPGQRGRDRAQRDVSDPGADHPGRRRSTSFPA